MKRHLLLFCCLLVGLWVAGCKMQTTSADANTPPPKEKTPAAAAEPEDPTGSSDRATEDEDSKGRRAEARKSLGL